MCHNSPVLNRGKGAAVACLLITYIYIFKYKLIHLLYMEAIQGLDNKNGVLTFK